MRLIPNNTRSINNNILPHKQPMMYYVKIVKDSLEGRVIKLVTNALWRENSQYVNSVVLCNAKNAVVGSGGLAVH